MVKFVDLDHEGGKTYNILLEHQQGRGYAHDMVAHWTEDEHEFKEGQILYLRIEGQCSMSMEVHEGNGKRGSSWQAEDDWYLVGRALICNATKLEKLK